MKGSITFTLITGVMMASSLLAIHMIHDNMQIEPDQPEIAEIDTTYHTWEGDTAFRISYGCGQVCADRPLRVQGGLSYVIASYCAGDYGDYEANTGHLLPHQYNDLIQPMKDAVIGHARDQGVDLWWVK